jgi:membrane dipeptidase
MTNNKLIPVFDGHNDTLMRFRKEDNFNFLERNEDGHMDLLRCREGGFAGGLFAVFISNPKTDDTLKSFADFKTADGYSAPIIDSISLEYAQQATMQMVAGLFRIETQSEGQFKVSRTAEEVQNCIDNDIMTAVLHFEGAEAIDTNFYSLEVFYKAGLRSLGIVWSRPTAFGYGVPFRYPHSPDTGPGLTDAGKELVSACNQLGIMIDLSHINEKGFWDVAKLTDAPLVTTHSNVHAICPLTRNLTDKQLDAIKESDGMVGLNFGVSFIREDGQSDANIPIEWMVRHINYLVERMGIDHVGFGSDFDGAKIPDKIGDVTGLPKLIDALRASGHDDESLRKIAHGNWVRVLGKTLKSN